MSPLAKAVASAFFSSSDVSLLVEQRKYSPWREELLAARGRAMAYSWQKCLVD